MASTDITLIGLDEATLSDDLVTVLADPSTNGGYKASLGDLSDYVKSELDESELSMELTEVSGNPITITDASNTNCETLIATLSPTQAGSGDPSPTNVRPISGVNQLSVNRTGKNLLNESREAFSVGDDYLMAIGITPNATVNMSFTDKDTSVDVSNCYIGFVKTGTSTIDVSQFRWVLKNGIIQSDRTNISSIDRSTICTSVFIYPKTEETYNKIFSRYNIQIERGSSATPYEPYQGRTLSLSLGSTVYGGSVDLNTGVLTVDKAMVDLGDFTWVYIQADNVFYNVMPTTCDYNAGSTDTLCSGFAYDTDATWYNSLGENQYMMCKDLYSLNRVSIAVKNTSVSTAEDFKALVTGMKFVYPLATPITTQLTPQTLRLLQGNNTLWTNAEGLEVEYQPNNFVGQLKAWILDQLG